MPLFEVLRLAAESLAANKFRSILTMLGMIIGVAAVVLLVAIGNGAKRYIFSEFEGLGTNLIVVQPGKIDKKNSFGPPIGSAQRKLTLADVNAIEKKAYNLEAVSGLVFGTTSVRYGENINNTNVFGSNDSLIKILNLRVNEGSFFTREEDEYGRRVIVLGNDVAHDLFGPESPLGRAVKLNQTEFRVIGVMEKVGSKLGLHLDNFCFIPATAALRLFNEDKLFGIRAKAASRSAVDAGVEEIDSILRERHSGEADFTIETQYAMMQSLETILNMLTYVLAGIALISMLVGGIGIMNIMLVSVAERTGEIGIRRAVGARRVDILQQFITEAVTLSLAGGLSGLLLAVSITYAVYFFVPAFDMRAPTWILGPAFLLSLFTGVIFGVWPAAKAAKIEALEALRYE